MGGIAHGMSIKKPPADAPISAGALALYIIMGLYASVTIFIIAVPSRLRNIRMHYTFLGITGILYLVRVISVAVFIAFVRRMGGMEMAIAYAVVFFELLLSGYSCYASIGCGQTKEDHTERDYD